MVDKLPSPAELRAQARRYRDQAFQTADAQDRRVHLIVADEYNQLAEAIEAELAFDESRRAPRASPRRPAP